MSLHQSKDKQRCFFAAQLTLSTFEFWRFFIVTAIHQFFGANISAVGTAAILGRKHPVPHTARGKQGGKSQEGKKITERFHMRGFSM
jgi:hypothetical protein